MMNMIIAALLIIQVLGHGRLTKPIPRFGTGSNNGLENAPVSGNAGDDFVCRHTTTANGPVTITPGGSLTLQWDFGAAHVGDCAVYVSYDVADGRAAQKYFKIANLYKCKDQNRQDITIDVPDWLPQGNAVIRWDWYALHQHPSVEFYSQCFDATIGGNNAWNNDIFTYSITAPAVYPATGNEGVGYRNPFGSGEQYMTGPPCAMGSTLNDCGLTACGTTGFVDVRAMPTGRRTQRLLQTCEDAHSGGSAACEAAESSWNMCSTPASTWWHDNCQKTCGLCNGGGNTGGGNTGTQLPGTTTADPSCAAYTIGNGNDPNNNNNDQTNTSGAYGLTFMLALSITLGLL